MVRVYYTSSYRCFLSWIGIEFDSWARQLIPIHSVVFVSIFTSIEGGNSTSNDIVERTAHENRLSNIIYNQTIQNKCNQNKSNCLGNRTQAQVAFLRSFTIASNVLQEAVSTACGYVWILKTVIYFYISRKLTITVEGAFIWINVILFYQLLRTCYSFKHSLDDTGVKVWDLEGNDRKTWIMQTWQLLTRGSIFLLYYQQDM